MTIHKFYEYVVGEFSLSNIVKSSWHGQGCFIDFADLPFCSGIRIGHLLSLNDAVVLFNNVGRKTSEKEIAFCQSSHDHDLPTN